MKQKAAIFLLCIAIMMLGSSCTKNEDKQYKASFKVDGVEKNYLTEKGELKVDPEMWQWWWFLDPEDTDSNGSFNLILRDTPTSGQVFNAEDIRFQSEYEKKMFEDDDEDQIKSVEMYYEDESGAMYEVNGLYGEGTLTITDWEGPGGFMRGTFSGEFEGMDSDETVSITEGQFEMFITTE